MASQINGLNANTASDLLRQAMLSSKAEEFHDHLDPGSETPSGVATPRPDPTDKRLPGITHAYFGQQVGSNFTSAPRESFLSRLSAALFFKTNRSEEGSTRETGSRIENMQNGGEVKKSEEHSNHRELSSRSGLWPKGSYPTPPPEIDPSFVQKEIKSGLVLSSMANGGEDVLAKRPAYGRLHSAPSIISSQTIRHTSGIKSLSGIVTSDSVLASHISNPASSPFSTIPSTPTAQIAPVFATDALMASLNESTKLIESVASTSRSKNTPPQTPRALSQTSGEPQAERPAPTSNPQQSPNIAASSVSRQTSPSKREGGGDSTPLPHIGTPKGKLSVKISEARGLRPSYDPYVVCVFEWNEYISKGPQHDVLELGGGEAMSRESSMGPLMIKRTPSDMGRPMAIPVKSRSGSTTDLSEQKNFKSSKQVTDPKWNHGATFDVVNENSDVDFYVYDRSNQEVFLGYIRMKLDVTENKDVDGWFKLEPRAGETETVTGEIHLHMHFEKIEKKHYGPTDFQILKLIGKGTFGQVYQVRKKDTHRIYAMKVLSKKVIVQKKEVAHTIGERNILVRTAMADSPFIVGLKFSFQTESDLYFVTDFMSGGELFWHLQKEGRFNEPRAKFYIAELILALEHLHKHDIVYRDLKPENILLDANGHIALCDFGLSKANLTKNETTNTFCGTTEYLAPEVLLDEQGYTKMVDFWSLGVLVFEMCCGWSPFYAEDTQQMYKNIAFGKVRFPRDALSTEGRNFVKGLLNRNPRHRLGATNDAAELKAHPFFADIDWEALTKKMIIPPFKPKLKSAFDTSNFDPEFTNALTNSSSLNARAVALAGGNVQASTPLSPGMQANFKGFTFVDESNMDEHFKNNELEAMDEDPEDEETNWENKFNHSRDDPMNGVVKTSTGEDGIFNNGQFDD